MLIIKIIYSNILWLMCVVDKTDNAEKTFCISIQQQICLTGFTHLFSGCRPGSRRWEKIGLTTQRCHGKYGSHISHPVNFSCC